MSNNQQPDNLQKLLEDMEGATEQGATVSVRTILEQIGSRSFGPLLLLAGVIVLAPLIGDIPGVPTIIGLFVFLLAVQLLLGRNHIWLPQWLLNKDMSAEKLRSSLKWLKKPARFLDRLLRSRLTMLVSGSAVYAIALTCLLVALLMPVMEVVPFSANLAGIVLTTFGLSMISKDGLLALIGFVVTLGAFVLSAYTLL